MWSLISMNIKEYWEIINRVIKRMKGRTDERFEKDMMVNHYKVCNMIFIIQEPVIILTSQLFKQKIG